MKITIVHLSDIHIRTEVENECFERVDSLAAAVSSRDCGDAVFIVVTGDIANSGLDTEYNLATQYLEELQKCIRKKSDIIPVLIMVPGNHDCDFTIADQNRVALINYITGENIPRETYEFCKSIQPRPPNLW